MGSLLKRQGFWGSLAFVPQVGWFECMSIWAATKVINQMKP